MFKKQILLVLFLIISLSCFVINSSSVFALNDCGNGTKTSVLPCTDSNGSTKVEDTPLFTVLVLVINIFTAGIGVIAVGSVVYGAILYASAGSSVDQTKKAIDVIKNVIIGVVAYALMYSFLNFIIPGGLL